MYVHSKKTKKSLFSSETQHSSISTHTYTCILNIYYRYGYLFFRAAFGIAIALGNWCDGHPIKINILITYKYTYEFFLI